MHPAGMAAVAAIHEAAFGKHPASNGAHKLGWWIAMGGMLAEQAARNMAMQMGVTPLWLEQVILGVIEPDYEERRALEVVTCGVIAADDFHRGGLLCWMDDPMQAVAA